MVLVPVVFYVIPLVSTTLIGFAWQLGWFIVPHCDPVTWSGWLLLPWCPQGFFHWLYDIIRSAVWGIAGVWAPVAIAPSHKRAVAITSGLGTVFIYIGFNVLSTPDDFRMTDWVNHIVTGIFGLITMWFFIASQTSNHPQAERSFSDTD